MKRADLTTRELCKAIDDHGVFAWEALVTRFPVKIVLAAVHRDTRRGFINWGVCPQRPFLDEAGRALLQEATA